MSPILTRMIGAGSAGSGFGFGRRRGGGGPSFSATGGTKTTYNGNTIHTFTAPGTFTVSNAPPTFNVEYVVVAGGGGGATNYGGGGGAGGYRTGSTPVGAPVSVQVGAGGLQTSSPTVTNGTPSYFGIPITSDGGGGGGPDVIDAANPGGSGGGGGLDTGPAGAGTNYPGPTQQGFPGGNGQRGVGPIGAGGGGGGAGGVGANAGSGGLGGPGVQIPTTFRNPAAPVGTPGPAGAFYVAGGGSSANPSYPVQSTPNPGGGGYQTSYPAGPSTSGVTNTGGGGGGSFQGPIAGDGGSGIVIIAYPS